jgi:Raf kinase inhibitor-like YbhB/YbcL family protein
MALINLMLNFRPRSHFPQPALLGGRDRHNPSTNQFAAEFPLAFAGGGTRLNMTMRMYLFLTAILCAGWLTAGCSSKVQPLNTDADKNILKLQVTSTAFAEGQTIPDKYTGQGDDVSPPLQWTPAPSDTKSLALICEDPDAPVGTFTHWVIYNVPATYLAENIPQNPTPGNPRVFGTTLKTSVSESIPKVPTLADGTEQGKNDFGNIGYNGPSPPPGKLHHYYFRLYALDTVLNLDPGASKSDLLAAMQGHVVGQGELMGTYQRQ